MVYDKFSEKMHIYGDLLKMAKENNGSVVLLREKKSRQGIIVKDDVSSTE